MLYILAGQKRGTLDVGVTRWPMQRLHQHRTGAIESLTERYGAKCLVHHEPFEAIAREKQVEGWRRAWKIDLIEAGNPTRRDLALDLGFLPLRPPGWTRMDPGSRQG